MGRQHSALACSTGLPILRFTGATYSPGLAQTFSKNWNEHSTICPPFQTFLEFEEFDAQEGQVPPQGRSNPGFGDDHEDVVHHEDALNGAPKDQSIANGGSSAAGPIHVR